MMLHVERSLPGLAQWHPVSFPVARRRVVCRQKRHRHSSTKPVFPTTPPMTWSFTRKAIALKHCTRLNAHSDIPQGQGLFDPGNDRDACGVGFIGELSKRPTRRCVEDALEMLRRMTHRGACGCEENTGALTVVDPNVPTLGFRRRCWNSLFHSG